MKLLFLFSHKPLIFLRQSLILGHEPLHCHVEVIFVPERGDRPVFPLFRLREAVHLRPSLHAEAFGRAAEVPDTELAGTEGQVKGNALRLV